MLKMASTLEILGRTYPKSALSLTRATYVLDKAQSSWASRLTLERASTSTTRALSLETMDHQHMAIYKKVLEPPPRIIQKAKAFGILGVTQGVRSRRIKRKHKDQGYGHLEEVSACSSTPQHDSKQNS